MGFARVWKRNGDAKYSAGGAGRDASASPSSCRANTPAPDGSFRFPREARLTRRLDIQSVVQEGRRIRTAYFDVRVLASPLSRSRIGIIVPRHHHTAVERNRLKRRMRELARLRLLPALRATTSHDIAIRARRDAYDARLEGMATDIDAILARLARLAAEPPAR
jgi:ribonuclease P protein component